MSICLMQEGQIMELGPALAVSCCIYIQILLRTVLAWQYQTLSRNGPARLSIFASKNRQRAQVNMTTN